MTAIERIEAQQSKFTEEDNTYWLAEQLKDICRADPHAAELVAQDLENENMDIVHLEKKIKAYADAHKKGGQACVPPPVAERIIREFYGISQGVKLKKDEPRVASILDLI